MPPPSSARHPPLLCIGHSHVGCIARAAEEGGVALTAFNFWKPDPPILMETPSGRQFTPGLRARLDAHGGTVFSSMGGGAYGVMGMLQHPVPFDFVLPSCPDLPLTEGAEILPADAVRDALMALTREYLELTRMLKSIAPAAVFHLEAPPPYPDADRMIPDIPWGMFPGMLQQVSPRYLRYKLWRLHSEIVAADCLEGGVAFVPCPAQALDGEGFLRSEYYGDGAHANVAYGALVLDQMRELA